MFYAALASGFDAIGYEIVPSLVRRSKEVRGNLLTEFRGNAEVSNIVLSHLVGCHASYLVCSVRRDVGQRWILAV